MSSSKPSGSEFRKRVAEKQQKEQNVLKKIPKISGFFNVAPKPQIGLQNPSSCDPVLDATTEFVPSIPSSDKTLEVERPKIKPKGSVDDQYDYLEKAPIHSPTSDELDTTRPIAIVHEYDSAQTQTSTS